MRARPASDKIPLMATLKTGDKGTEVQNLQRMLNAVLVPSPNLTVDGVYGPLTQAAVARFQMRMRTRPTGSADPQTVAALSSKAKGQGKLRGPLVPEFPFMRESALQVALKQTGVEEDAAHTNHGVKVEMYLASVKLGGGNPWCAAYVCWCYAWAAKKSGAHNPILMTGDCYALYQWAESTHRLTDNPVRGDVFLVKGGAWVVQHTGFVIRVAGKTVDTIEGNTNPAGGSDGYGVFKRNRDMGSCLFVHVC